MSGSPLDDARVALKQGLLGPASAALSRVPADAPPADRAATALFTGNIAYERGQYPAAEQAWLSARALYAQAESGGAGLSAVNGNLAMAREHLARQQELDARAGGLRVALAVVLLFAAVAVLLAHRMSRTSSSTAERAQ
jgi:hypothetical protein